jgi:hypothetical protein
MGSVPAALNAKKALILEEKSLAAGTEDGSEKEMRAGVGGPKDAMQNVNRSMQGSAVDQSLLIKEGPGDGKKKGEKKRLTYKRQPRSKKGE